MMPTLFRFLVIFYNTHLSPVFKIWDRLSLYYGLFLAMPADKADIIDQDPIRARQYRQAKAGANFT